MYTSNDDTLIQRYVSLYVKYNLKIKSGQFWKQNFLSLKFVNMFTSNGR